jgi:regulator of sigma E protease
MLTAIVFIIVLGLLIFVHELGHFLVARKNGIRAYEFGFGFPPRIFGIQPLKGKKLIKVGQKEEITDEIYEISTQDGAIIKETVTDKVTEIDILKKEKKWRFIWGKRDTDREWKLGKGENEGTIYSVNWIPLGGFVKIKGEDGSHANDPDSFSARSAWIRTKVLLAGVGMNFLLGWVLLALVLVIGAPEAVDDANARIQNAKIQISQVVPASPAQLMGIQPGDEIIKCENPDEVCQKDFQKIADVQNFIRAHKGEEITFKVQRGNEILDLRGVPRTDYPEGEGALGISLARTAIVQYPWYEAIIKGFTNTVNVIVFILSTLWDLIRNIFVGEKVAIDISGPVGIAYLTKQVTELGIVYILQFAALLSINLGIINGFPFPALDGGRILFILIEKIKGSPVSQKVENIIHTTGFVLLIILMILVTWRDVVRFDVVEKIGNFF